MKMGFLAPSFSPLGPAFGLEPEDEEIVRTHASLGTIQLTSANWPQSRQVNFDQPLEQLRWLKREGKDVHLNMLIGNHVNPAWFANGNWTAAQLDQHMEFWIRSVANAFGDEIDSVVVLNEAVWDPAATGGNTWNNSGSYGKWWGMGTDKYGGSSPEYGRRAFELARAYFPANVKLVYNDYNHGNLNGKANAIYDFVWHLSRSNSTKPDVIGFQSHYAIRNDGTVFATDQGPSTPPMHLASWGENIDRYTRLGIESHITELDMEIPANTSNWRYAQAKELARIADFAAKRDDVTVITCWGNRDGTDPEWIPNGNARLFFNNGSTKLAFYGVQLGLMGIVPDQTYRISDDWTEKYVLVGGGSAGTHVVTHRSNPSWGAGKWTVRLGNDGSFRLESLEYPLRFLQADSDGFARLASGSGSGRQSWRAGLGPFGNRVTLANLNNGLFLNSMGLHDNAWLGVWMPNGFGNQSWLFQPEP